jgi:peroxiredoxin Q/BCP
MVQKLRAGDPARLASATIGKPAPDFKLQSLTEQQISLNSFRGKQAVVLVFIDGDTWPVCHCQLAQWRDQRQNIAGSGAAVIASDPHESDAAKSLLKDAGFADADLQYPLLLDPTQTVSAMYGVAFQMRIHTKISNRPATFIIDNLGTLQYARRGSYFGDRPNVANIIAELKKLPE